MNNTENVKTRRREDGKTGRRQDGHHLVFSFSRLLVFCFVLLPLTPTAHAAQLTINIGTTNNDGTGDTLRSAMQKVNTNFTTLFNSVCSSNGSSSGNPTMFVATNECHVVPTTNLLVISGAGTAAANGIYTQDTVGIYIKTATTHGIYNDGIDWVLTNSTGTPLYSTDEAAPIGNWVIALGQAPAPSSAYSDMTNCFAVPFYGGHPQDATVTYVNSNTLQNVVQVNAGDNISNILLNARSGTTYEFDTGTNQFPGTIVTHDTLRWKTTLKLTNVQSVWLKGSGNTVLHGTNDGALFGIQQCTNIRVSGFVFRVTKTNSTAYDAQNVQQHPIVACYGSNDTVSFEDCRFEGGNSFGVLLSGAGTPMIRTWRAIFRRCVFYETGHTNTVGTSFNPDCAAIETGDDVLVEQCQFIRCAVGVEFYSDPGQPNQGQQLVIRDCLFKDLWSRNIFFNGNAATCSGVIDGNFFTTDATRRPIKSLIELKKGNGVWVTRNVFTNIAQSSDYCIDANAITYGNSRDVNVIDNYFSHVSHAIAFGFQQQGRIAGNRFEWITNATIQLTADAALIEGNTFFNCGLATGGGSAPIYCFFDPGTNCIIRNNRFIRKAGGAPESWMFIDSAQRGYLIAGNHQEDVSGSVPLIQDTGIGTAYVNAFGESSAAVTMNASTNYTVALRDTVIGVTNSTTGSGARVVTLPSATQIPGRILTFFDPGTTAAGSNIWVLTVSSQKINNGPVLTNISANNGSLTLQSAGGGWRIISKFP